MTTNLETLIKALEAGDYDSILAGTKYRGSTKGKWSYEDNGDTQSVTTRWELTEKDRPRFHESFTHGSDIICDNENYYPASVAVEDMKLIADSKSLAARCIVLEAALAKAVDYIQIHGDWFFMDNDPDVRPLLAATKKLVGGGE